MTAQIGDVLRFEGRDFRLASEPLAPWLSRPKNREMRFLRRHSARSRGYAAAWEICRGRLYLRSFKARLASGQFAGPNSLFVNYSAQYLDSVRANDPANQGPGKFAFWLTGTLTCPIGSLLAYRHAAYLSLYERELHLSFRDGYLLGTRIVVNEVPAPPSDEAEWDDPFADDDLPVTGPTLDFKGWNRMHVGRKPKPSA